MDPDRNRPTEPKKTPPGGDRNDKQPQGGSAVWYLVGLGVLVLLLVTLFSGGGKTKLTWYDFERLVRASDTNDETAPGKIQIIDDSQEPAQKYEVSDLKITQVAPRKVLGKVRLTPLGEAAATSPTPGEAEVVPFVANRDANDESIGPLLTEMGIPYDNSGEPHALLSYLPMLFVMGLMILLLLFMFRRIGGAGSPMAFGRSRGKLMAQEDLDITFDDVAGIEEAVDELREVVDFLREPERYQRLGGRIPKGVLLVGPPGTGKTLLAKAVAGEAAVPFFSLSGSDFVEMFVGVGAARVRDMFQQAEQKAPCIIFIDELDALGKTRGSGNIGGHDEREQTLNALLVEMDGFGTNSGVIVMGATNRPETLDPALMRPGRFDRQVLVDRPDVAGREKILEVHLANVKVGDDVDTAAVAAITSGFVGADLANIVNEAALLAARNGQDMVAMADFNEAVERVGIGLEKKSRILQEDEKQRTAYHEAGHALVAYSLPNTDPVHKVTIIPRGIGALGYMWQRPEVERFTKTRSQLESDIKVCLAGTLAEEIVYDEIATGASNDLQKSTEVARSMVMDYGMSRMGRVNFREQATGFLGQEGYSKHHSEQTAREIDEEVNRIINDALDSTRSILTERRPALEAITGALLEREVIDSEELKEIIEATLPGARIVPGTETEKKPSTPAKPAKTQSGAAEG